MDKQAKVALLRAALTRLELELELNAPEERQFVREVHSALRNLEQSRTPEELATERVSHNYVREYFEK